MGFIGKQLWKQNLIFKIPAKQDVKLTKLKIYYVSEFVPKFQQKCSI